MKLFECSHAREYETLNKRWADVETRLFRLELSEKDFRDKVLRKIQKQKDQEVTENTQDLYGGMLISDK